MGGKYFRQWFTYWLIILIGPRTMASIPNVYIEFYTLQRTQLFSLDPPSILSDSLQENVNNWILSVCASAMSGMYPTTRLWKMEADSNWSPLSPSLVLSPQYQTKKALLPAQAFNRMKWCFLFFFFFTESGCRHRMWLRWGGSHQHQVPLANPKKSRLKPWKRSSHHWSLI